MQAVATATWITVRCPCRRAVLLEQQGYGPGPLLRRVCPKCKGLWVIDPSSGQVRPDEAAVWRRASA